MNAHDLALILQALSAPRTAFILGAGASAPAVPTFAQLAGTIAGHVRLLSSFPATGIAPSALRDLMQPVIDHARRTSDLAEWKAGAMTTATIAAILERVISRAHQRPLAQYSLFSQIPIDSSVVSFNWDGLALARCPQRVVLHPHGIVQPRALTDQAVEDLLFDTQGIDTPSARHWFLPHLVMPGEENGPDLAETRETVLQLWLNAPSFVVIGYSFGIASRVSYDEIWLDSFAEACSRSADAPVHILSPDAETLRQALCERVRRSINVFGWPLRWDVLATSLLRAIYDRAVPLAGLVRNLETLQSIVRQIAERSERA